MWYSGGIAWVTMGTRCDYPSYSTVETSASTVQFSLPLHEREPVETKIGQSVRCPAFSGDQTVCISVRPRRFRVPHARVEL